MIDFSTYIIVYNLFLFLSKLISHFYNNFIVMKKKAPTKGKAKLIPTNIKPTNVKKKVMIN